MKTLKDLLAGNIPGVVGTISTFRGLQEASMQESLPCDIVEVRLDRMSASDSWLLTCEKIEAMGVPVILTIRLQSEGGAWTDEDSARLRLFNMAIEKLSAIDIELSSPLIEKLRGEVDKSNAMLLVSYHNFEETPPIKNLSAVVDKAARKGADIIKLATKINDSEDAQRLLHLLEHHTGNVPLCVIGMGPKGVHTRFSFPALGSCLAYGYLDNPSAPGQLSCHRIVEHLRVTLPSFNESFIIQQKVLECA